MSIPASGIQHVLHSMKAFLASTKMVWIETPTDPTLKIFDIGAISDLSHNGCNSCS